MPYAFFYELFPEIAVHETRSITITENFSSIGLPPGEYGFLEMYCNEKKCDCRRVFFYVVIPAKKEPLAVIAYGWESKEFYARWMRNSDPETIRQLQGPVFNIGSPQSKLAPAIMKVVEDILLQDELYLERIKTHYRMFRDKIDRKLPMKRIRSKIKKRTIRR